MMYSKLHAALLIIDIIHELCQHLGSLRSLWKAPETKTLGGGTECPPPYKVGLKLVYISIPGSSRALIDGGDFLHTKQLKQDLHQPYIH